MSGLSGEDRARLELLAEVCGQYIGGACRRALALIDQQEKALEAADDAFAALDRGVSPAYALTAYRSARATSTKEDG